jgi:hypothetical protein
MNLLLELADSEVRCMEWVGGDLHIHFSAAAVRQRDAETMARRTGYARAVELVLFGATLAPTGAAPMGRIADGRLGLAERWSTRLPLPQRVMAPARLELRFAQHGEWVVLGQGVACQFTGESNFTESLSC